MRNATALDYSPPTCSVPYRERLWSFDSLVRSVYIAASVDAQSDALKLAFNLSRAGFHVTSSWLSFNFHEAVQKERSASGWWKEASSWARRDIADLMSADALIVLTTTPSSSGGMHFELGYFLGQGKTDVLVVGADTSQIFYTLPPVRWADKLSSDEIVRFIEKGNKLHK